MFCILIFKIISVENFAVLMSGSKGFSNYRHQADLYSWQQLLLSRGFKKDNIISLCYNDIKDIPIKHTCQDNEIITDIDYEGITTTKTNFLNILKNIEKDNITGKIWRRKTHINNFAQEFININNKHLNFTGISSKDINVIIVYINHGINGFLSVPNRFDEDIYIDDLVEAVNSLSLHVKNVVLIIEACFSGSFVLDGNWSNNVLVIAASGANQSSYSFGWCEHLKTFTTDEFTYYTLDYLDRKNTENNTLRDFINYVSKNVKHSHILTKPSKIFNEKIKNIFGNYSGENFLKIREALTNSEKTNYKSSTKKLRPNINRIVDTKYYRIKNDLIISNSFRKYSWEKINDNSCFKDITKITKKICYKDINENNLWSIYKIGHLCQQFNKMDIINSINNIC